MEMKGTVSHHLPEVRAVRLEIETEIHQAGLDIEMQVHYEV